MAMCLSYRATHMILSFDQSERNCSCKLACALFLVTVKICIPLKLHKALK